MKRWEWGRGYYVPTYMALFEYFHAIFSSRSQWGIYKTGGDIGIAVRDTCMYNSRKETYNSIVNKG